MQFQVPQFIEVEDKIFGPLTFRQFVFLLGAAGMSYLLWRVFPFFIAAPLIAGAVGLGAALAFFKYNGQSFIVALENGFYYFVHTKLYLWSSESSAPKPTPKSPTLADITPASNVYVPKLSESKLHDLAWSLDIQERIQAGTAREEERGTRRESDALAPIHTAREALIR